MIVQTKGQLWAMTSDSYDKLIMAIGPGVLINMNDYGQFLMTAYTDVSKWNNETVFHIDPFLYPDTRQDEGNEHSMPTREENARRLQAEAEEPEPELGFICLNEGEDEGIAECGCRLLRETTEWEHGPSVFLCPLHSAAQEMCEALEEAAQALQDAATFNNAPEGYWDKGGGGHKANEQVLDALAKATK